MDRSERAVYDFLRARGFKDVIYEPDGNIPPDFLVKSHIAVEVRRVNQHDETESNPRGLEETAYPLMGRFRAVLTSLGPPLHGESWFVSYTFRRPLPAWSALEDRVKMALARFRDSNDRKDCVIAITDRFEIDVRRASKMHATFLLLGAVADHDSGGFVLAELDRNIRICVADKTQKASRVWHKYPEWWLALVDHIGYGGLDDTDCAQLRETLVLEHPWQKILLVSPLDPHDGFEL